MRRLVILGNGFDIAHDLHTNYSDFMKYLLANETPSQSISENEYSLFTNRSIDDLERKALYEDLSKYIPEQDLWSSFEQALGALDDEYLRDDNSCYLLSYGDENWRDSAHHDYQYMISEALAFADDIPNQFRKWISTIDTHVTPKAPLDIISNDCLFLNFNYTDTLETSYDISEEHILYIHGKALRGDELILGHHEEDLIQDKPEPQFASEEEYALYLEYYDEDVRITEANEIIKGYFRKTYKDTSAIIQKNQAFFAALKDIGEIYILGHSLSLIDFEYFSEIKQNVSLFCHWNISYHNDKDYRHAKQLITLLNIQNYTLFYF